MKRIGLTGASGLVGSEVAELLEARGFEVVPFKRGGQTTETQIGWDPENGVVDPADIKSLDAVVHLAGESIVGRWSEKKKRKIMNSRINGTRALVDAIAATESVAVFICASAIGIYGSNGDTWVDESSERGDGFLADVVEAWEREAAKCPVRWASLRFGIVLSKKGGALEKMLTPFRMGTGGPLGDGTQFMSWVSLTDVARAIVFVLEADVRGPVNVVSPNPVSNQAFTKALGRVLGRPTIFRLPKMALRLALGDAADELLLYSQRVNPRVLTDAGFEFGDVEIEAALRRLLT